MHDVAGDRVGARVGHRAQGQRVGAALVHVGGTGDRDRRGHVVHVDREGLRVGVAVLVGDGDRDRVVVRAVGVGVGLGIDRALGPHSKVVWAEASPQFTSTAQGCRSRRGRRTSRGRTTWRSPRSSSGPPGPRRSGPRCSRPRWPKCPWRALIPVEDPALDRVGAVVGEGAGRRCRGAGARVGACERGGEAVAGERVVEPGDVSAASGPMPP